MKIRGVLEQYVAEENFLENLKYKKVENFVQG